MLMVPGASPLSLYGPTLCRPNLAARPLRAPGRGGEAYLKAEVDEGYRGLANEFPSQVTAPPRKPKTDALLGDQYSWRETRRRQPSRRICVEHTNAEYKQWRPLQIHRPPGDLHRNPPGSRRAGLRPIRPPGHPPQDQYRTGARPTERMLTIHQPKAQASTP
ncbi:hypothetical protein GCM10018966_040520 [Streptomyces yanii]